MLKLMPTFNFNSQPKTKCGEIFCHNTNDFTVYCTFCEMKSFSFEDFLRHLKTLHFASEVCKNESTTYCNTKLEAEEDKIYDTLIKSYDDKDQTDFENTSALDDRDFDDDDADCCDNDSYDEPLVVLKKKLVKQRSKRRKTKTENKSDQSEEDVCRDFYSDEEFKPRLIENAAIHSCPQCSQSFKTAGLLRSHLNRTHDDKSSENSLKKEGKQIPCNECDQIFPSKKSLYGHIVDYHMGFKCNMCDKRFKQLQQRDRHEFCHTAARVFSCHIEGCDKSFTHKYYLQRHLDSHNKERKFVCDFENCSKAFHTLRCLKAHKNRHTKPKNLICDTCGYTCREYDRLRIHQRVHTGEKPYGCQECGKRFTSNAALLEHTASHTGIRSHVCNQCNATFTRQKSLHQHRLKCTASTVTAT